MPDQAFATPTLSPAEGAVAATPTPGSAGNAARLEAAGLVSAQAPSPWEDALAILGDAAGLVLDRLPLAQAAPLAWAARDTPWAQRWLGSVPAARLATEAEGTWAAVLDLVWPVGQAVEVGASAAAGALVGATGAYSVRVERTAGGARVALGIEGGATVGVGVGVDAGAAGGELLAGLGIAAEIAAGAAGTVEWSVEAVPPTGVFGIARYRSAPWRLAEELVRDLAARGVRPDRWRVEERGSAQARGEAGAVQGQGRLGAGGAGAVAVGRTHDVAFAEITLGASVSGRLAGAIFDAVTAFGGLTPGLLTQSLAAGLTLRVEGSPEALDRMDFREGEYVLTERSTAGTARTEDTFRTREARAAAAWLQARLLPGGQPFGAGSPPATIPKSALPDVTLTRTVARPVLDLEVLRSLVPDLWEIVVGRLPGHGPLLGVESAELDATLTVGRDAVADALAPDPLPVGDSVEEAVLAVERRIAASVVGGNRSAGDLPLPLDLAAGARRVGTRSLTAVVRARVAAGVGAEVDAAAEIDASGEAGVTVERSVELGEDPRARAWLLEGA